MNKPAFIYLKVFMLVVVTCFTTLEISAQKSGIVVGADNLMRITGVNIRTNTNKDFRTNMYGIFWIKEKFSSATFHYKGYLARTLTYEEMGDTIVLLPLSIGLDEVVVTAKAPKIGFPIKDVMNKVTKGYSKPSGMDFLSVFKRNKVSGKERKRRQDAIDNY